MVLIAWNHLCRTRIASLTSQLLTRWHSNLSRSHSWINRVQSKTYATKSIPKSKPGLAIEKEVPWSRKILLLLIPITTFGLGTWQIFRLQWKLGLIKDLELRTSAAAVPLASIVDNLNDMEYYRVVVNGIFDHSREQYIGPRSLNKDKAVTSRQPNESGMHVITPFVCIDPDMTILVNRGWVPRSRVDPSTREKGQVEGEITLTGIVRLTDKRRPFMPHNDPEKGRWFWRENAALAELLGTSSVFIDADARNADIKF